MTSPVCVSQGSLMVCTVEELFLSLACPPPLTSHAILRQASFVPVPSILSPEAQGVPECWDLGNALTFKVSRSFATYWSPVDLFQWFGYKAYSSALQALRQRVMSPVGKLTFLLVLKVLGMEIKQGTSTSPTWSKH